MQRACSTPNYGKNDIPLSLEKMKNLIEVLRERISGDKDHGSIWGKHEIDVKPSALHDIKSCDEAVKKHSVPMAS